MQEIHIAAAAIIRADGRFLLVRKHGTSRFMQAGGKLDSGETAAQALARELMEELSLDISALDVRYLGELHAPAANEAGMSVRAEQFVIHYDGELMPMAELEEVIWASLDEALLLPLAPLLTEQVIPLLKAEKLL
jgi:8-oxo-dGTP diphosphatase